MVVPAGSLSFQDYRERKTDEGGIGKTHRNYQAGCLMQDFSKMKCTFIKKDDIRARVEEFRQVYWKPGLVPVDIEYIIEHALRTLFLPSD